MDTLILVAGATGNTGSAVVDALVAAGRRVRALTRSPDRLPGLIRPGVDALAAEFDDPTALARAMDGVDAAYLVTPTAPNMATAEGAFAAAAARAGVHVVKLSTMGADPGSPLRFGRAHAAAEQAIESSGADWTFVQPNGFMQNDLAWAAQITGGVIATPVLDATWSIVDARDVAAVAAAALIDPTRHRGRRITVTGPAAVSPRHRIESLANVLALPLRPVDVAIPAALDELARYGVDSWQLDGLRELLELYTAGLATAVATDGPELLDRPMTPWHDFARDHRRAFVVHSEDAHRR